LAGLFGDAVLRHRTFRSALSHRLAGKLEDRSLPADELRDVIDAAHRADPSMVDAARADLGAILESDPACTGYVRPFLFYKGFLALQSHRVAHWLYKAGHEARARQLQARGCDRFDVSIHPGARVGRGVFIDHGSGIVIGETAVVGDGVSILQGVTLGGSGAAGGDRHPKIGRGVLLSAGATVLGPVTVGDHAKVAASSLVLSDVPTGCTAVGVPARLVNCPGCG